VMRGLAREEMFREMDSAIARLQLQERYRRHDLIVAARGQNYPVVVGLIVFGWLESLVEEDKRYYRFTEYGLQRRKAMRLLLAKQLQPVVAHG